MAEEMLQRRWPKAISQERDRRQSQVLVWVVGTLLVWMSVDVVRAAFRFEGRFPAFVLEVFALSAGFALIVRRLRAATPGGAAGGGMICLLVTFWTGVGGRSVVQSGLMPLVLLFVLTFLATRAGRRRKAKAVPAEGRRGRSAAQVIANLSVAGICVSPLAGWVAPGDMSQLFAMKVMCVAALVEATADTVSSEIGQAFGGRPVMITTMRRAEPGTDGAVTLLGSAAGVAGGLLVAVTGGWTMGMGVTEVVVALGAGVCGLFFDSFVGATVERRGWVGNDLVNFASTGFAAGVAGVVLRWLKPV